MALYALSYDEVDALADFARTHAITFPLLSDPDSEVIGRFGILNTTIDADDHPWFGVPYPGTYVMDPTGTVTDKFFESSFMLRPSAAQLLRAACGDTFELEPLDAAPEQVTFDVTFDGEVLRAGVLRELVVRFSVPEGQHLYGQPVPEGMVATSIEIDPAVGVVTKPPIFPPTTPHTLAASGETLQVFEGEVQIRVPITHVGRSLTTLDDGTLALRVEGTVRWQSCDDDVCHLPRTERFSVDVAAERHDGPDGMDVTAHLTKMVGRRTDRSLAEVLDQMTGNGPDDEAEESRR